MPKLMTEKETAAMLGMSVHWLRKKRWEGGGIPYIKMTERGAVRYSEEIVMQYLDTRFRTCTSGTCEQDSPQAQGAGTGAWQEGPENH